MFKKIVDKYFIKKPKIRGFITEVIYGSRDKRVSLLGAEVIVNSLSENGYLRASGAAGSRSLFRDEASVIINLGTFLHGNVCFVDIGANIGIYSSVFARMSRLNSELRVVAFEVDPRTFLRLSLNAKINGFEAEMIGISDTRRKEKFVRGVVSHVTSVADAYNPYKIEGEDFYSDVMPLDQFEFGSAALVVKIDVEGHERQVLMGMEALIRQGRVRAIYFDGVADNEIVRSYLVKNGFVFFNGRTLGTYVPNEFSLLAVHETFLTSNRPLN